MSSLFPAPVHAYATHADDASATADVSALALTAARASHVPAYPRRVAAKFVPRALEDFGDGGAFPEIHLAQFPLNMGKKGGGGSVDTLALQVRGDGDGARVSYDAIVTQHHRDKAKVFTKFTDLVEKDDAKPQALPSREEEIETANRTRDALQQLVQGKISAALPVNVTRQKTAKESSTYIRYTPHDQGKMGAQSQQRIIRMVEVAKDPMEPPKFQHKKAVRGPPSPPVPVLHSPPRKLTVKDQQSWKIPPVISNWKNSKGFTIALDKRLAADGRGLQQPTVNDNFASLAEALAIAERKAREEVNMRAQVQKKLAMKQKEEKENELREMAQRARMERAGIRDDDAPRGGHYGPSRSRSRSRSSNRGRGRGRSRSRSRSGSEDEDDAQRERERIRRERKKERERDLRMEKLGKRGKLARDDDRDVSEKIALGQLQGTGKLSGEAMFDSRLFNQSQGIGAGFGADDDYTVYSKPMVDRGKASVYRPKADDSAFADADKDFDDLKSGHAKRFKADRQFRGTEQVGHGRDGPVQFSYDDAKPSRRDSDAEEETKRGNGSDDDDDGRRGGRGRSPSRSVSRSRSRTPPRSRPTNSSRRRSPSRSRSRSRSRDRGGRRAAPSRRRSPSRSRSRSPSRDRKRSRRDRSASDSDSDDPYGLDQFLSDARKSSSTTKDAPRRR